jgi:glucokinase
LAADIGGTNSRFALFKTVGDGLEMEDSIWLESHGVSSFSNLLQQLWDSDFPVVPGGFDSAALAVAGAVQDGVECRKLPNVPWSIDLRTVKLGTNKAYLLNDFAAQAFACRTKIVDDATVIQDGLAQDNSVIGVIGAGTGLGYSALMHTGRKWTALSSEGGHMAFPFVGMKEAEYGEFNRRESGRHWAEGDSVVTGLGLTLVHKFLTGEDLTPKEISAKITMDSETTKWFSRFYGRACRNWALALMSFGGLYIAGGVAAKNKMFVTSPEFLEEFHNSHIYSDFLHSVSLKLNANEESGLYGAAFYGAQLLAG